MSNSDYSIHLGGGLYMDSKGVLSHGPILDKPTYQTSGNSLPIKPEALEKALTGIKKALPDMNDPKSIEKLQKLHIPDEFIMALAQVGKIAGDIAKAIPYVGTVVSVLSMLGLLKEGPSSVEALMDKRYNQLKGHITALQKMINNNRIDTSKSDLTTALGYAGKYIESLQEPLPNPHTIATAYSRIASEMFKVHSALNVLLGANTWMISFDSNERKTVWYLMQGQLFCSQSDGALRAARMPNEGQLYFDHRLMVPIVTYTIENYLTLIRLISPEHRSTRQWTRHLHDMINQLDTLIINMRSSTLARTIYTAEHFKVDSIRSRIPFGIYPGEVLDLGLIDQSFSHIPPVMLQSNRFSVGALDLSNHNDEFFGPNFAMPNLGFSFSNQVFQRGMLNVGWIPPATLERYHEFTLGEQHTRYRITNPEECAAAANAQSELDYANLLYSSGYLSLVHLAGLLRQQACHPDHSETVTISANVLRKPLDSVPATVESEYIFLTGVITSPAEQQPQLNEVRLQLTTQPLNRDISLSYRVLLRTLNVNPYSPGRLLEENEYDTYYSVKYIDDSKYPSFQELVTSNGQALDEVQLVEQSFGSPELRSFHDWAELEAITFDWWIPVKPPLHQKFDKVAAANLTKLRSFGWTATLKEEYKYSPLRDVFHMGGWVDGNQTWEGEHRKLVTKKIKLEYTVHWQEDQMTITLKSRPEDRNYIVFLVVEETLPDRDGRTKTLHTAQRIPINGQLTLVPQAFFDQEKAAYEWLRKLWAEFTFRFTKSVNPGPLDPVADLINSANLATALGVQRALKVAQQHQPELLQQTLRDYNIDPEIINSLHDLSVNVAKSSE